MVIITEIFFGKLSNSLNLDKNMTKFSPLKLMFDMHLNYN